MDESELRDLKVAELDWSAQWWSGFYWWTLGSGVLGALITFDWGLFHICLDAKHVDAWSLLLVQLCEFFVVWWAPSSCWGMLW